MDSLSENTKRGLRQKVKRGEYPGPAPVGYINDSRTKTVVVDRKKAKIIRGAFELYAEGNSRLEDVSDFLAQRGILSRGGKRIHKTRATFILSNPFYIGLFKYGGERHEGKYEPIIAKKIFDEVQEVLKQRGRPHHKTKYEPQDLCGLLKCGSCGMSITGEYRVKKQKRIGRISPCLCLPFPKVSPPNPHAKKIFEAERKFVCPVPLGEYRVRDI